MAYLNSEIIIKAERRPCFVNHTYKAFFHGWVTDHVFINKKDVGAIVEYDNGNVVIVPYSSIRFADGGDFEQYACFESRCKKNENNS